MLGGGFIELLVFEGFGEPRGVEAEVDADVAVLVEAGIVEFRAEAEDADGGWLKLPEGVEGGGFVFGVDVGVGIDIWVWVVRAQFRGPELPAHLELVGHVVVELLRGFGYGVFDDGAGGVGVFLGAVIVDVDALVGGCFGEADGIDAGCRYALFSADERELAHDRNHGRGEGLEAEVGEPETEVELIGHKDSLDPLKDRSCRTGPLRVGRSLRDVYIASLGAPVGRELKLVPTSGEPMLLILQRPVSVKK